MQNPFIDWLRELVQRLGTKSPKFFVVINWIAGALIAVTGIPPTIEWLGFDKFLPETWKAFSDAAVAKCALAALFISALTTKPKAVGVTDNLDVVTERGNKLPFSQKAELKSALKKVQKDEIPVVTVIHNDNQTTPTQPEL